MLSANIGIDELTHILKWNILIVRLKWKICVSIKAFCMWSFLSFKTLWAFTDLLHIILSLSFHHIHYALISFYVKKIHFLGQSLPCCLSLNSRFILYNLGRLVKKDHQCVSGLLVGLHTGPVGEPIRCTKNALRQNMSHDSQHCGILTCVDSDEHVQPPFKHRNSK